MTGSGSAEIPALVERLAARLFPEPFADEFLDDLLDERDSRSGSDAFSRRSFARFCWLQILSPSTVRLAMMLRRRNGGTAPRATHRRSSLFSDLLQDFRFAIRSFRRRSQITITALATLVLSVAGLATAYALYDGVMLSSPVDPDRLLNITGIDVTNTNLPDWRASIRTVDELTSFELSRGMVQTDGVTESLRVMPVSDGFFNLIGARPRYGRLFGQDDHSSAAAPTAVVSEELWSRRFPGRTQPNGEFVTVDGVAHEVVGVLPYGFHYRQYAGFDLWVPFHLRDSNAGTLVAWMAEGESIERVRSEFARVGRGMGMTPEETEDVRVSSVRQSKSDNFGEQLLTFLGIALLVLVAAASNLCGLFLTMVTDRVHELGIRRALGGSRARVTRQVLTETLVLTLVGGVGGIALASLSTRALISLAPTALRIASDRVVVDAPVIAVALGATLAAAILFGWIPARIVTGTMYGKETNAGSLRTGRLRTVDRWLSRLVSAQVVVTTIVLIGSGLLYRTYRALEPSQPGFDPSGILVTDVIPPPEYANEPDRFDAYLEELIARVGSEPGSPAIIAVNDLPLSGLVWVFPLDDADAIPAGRTLPTADLRVSTPGYHELLSIPLLDGIDLLEARARNISTPAVINQRLAEALWPDEPGSAIGHTITLTVDDPTAFTVVGVSRNVRNRGGVLRSAREMFVSIEDVPLRQVRLLTRANGLGVDFDRIRTLGAALDPAVAIQAPRMFESVTRESNALTRFNAMITLALTGVTLTLAAVGLFGTLAFRISRRQREIGVRMAIGAQRSNVLREIMGAGLRLVLTGLTLGWLLALLLAGLIENQLYGVVSTRDGWTLALAPLVILAITLCAAFVPARRATRIEPVSALRSS